MDCFPLGKIMRDFLTRHETVIAWISNIFIVAAGICTSQDIIPLNKYLYFIAAAGWFFVGIVWRQSSVWGLNLFLMLMFGYGLL